MLQIIGGGFSFVALEKALGAASEERIESLGDVGLAGRRLKVLFIPTLNPGERLSISQTDLVVIMIDPADPSALDRAEAEASLLEKSLLARKLFGFCLWKVCDQYRSYLLLPSHYVVDVTHG